MGLIPGCCNTTARTIPWRPRPPRGATEEACQADGCCARLTSAVSAPFLFVLIESCFVLRVRSPSAAPFRRAILRAPPEFRAPARGFQSPRLARSVVGHGCWKNQPPLLGVFLFCVFCSFSLFSFLSPLCSFCSEFNSASPADLGFFLFPFRSLSISFFLLLLLLLALYGAATWLSVDPVHRDPTAACPQYSPYPFALSARTRM